MMPLRCEGKVDTWFVHIQAVVRISSFRAVPVCASRSMLMFYWFLPGIDIDRKSVV